MEQGMKAIRGAMYPISRISLNYFGANFGISIGLSVIVYHLYSRPAPAWSLKISAPRTYRAAFRLTGGVIGPSF
jgi:hypothetical protein